MKTNIQIHASNMPYYFWISFIKHDIKHLEKLILSFLQTSTYKKTQINKFKNRINNQFPPQIYSNNNYHHPYFLYCESQQFVICYLKRKKYLKNYPSTLKILPTVLQIVGTVPT